MAILSRTLGRVHAKHESAYFRVRSKSCARLSAGEELGSDGARWFSTEAGLRELQAGQSFRAFGSRLTDGLQVRHALRGGVLRVAEAVHHLGHLTWEEASEAGRRASAFVGRGDEGRGAEGGGGPARMASLPPNATPDLSTSTHGT